MFNKPVIRITISIRNCYSSLISNILSIMRGIAQIVVDSYGNIYTCVKMRFEPRFQVVSR